MNMRFWVIFFTYVLAALYTATAVAMDFCAIDEAEIQAALTAAASNGEDDHIKIKQGSYDSPAGGFYYGFGDQNAEFFALTISGGWHGNGSDPCAQQSINSPESTVIDGGFSNRIMRIFPSNSTDITITDIFFNDGFVDLSQGGGALYIGTTALPTVYTGAILIERNVFYNNYGDYGAVLLDTSSGEVHVRNNLFTLNQTLQSSTAAFTYWPTVAGSEGRLYFTNNTVVLSTTASGNPNASSGVSVVSPPGTFIYLANNILWNNQVNDLRINGDGIRAMAHNDIGSQYISQPLDNDLNNISVDPLFQEPNNMDFSLNVNSLLVNVGYNSPGSAAWFMGDFDAAGRSRVHSGTIDIGAYEFYPDFIFGDGFE